MDNEKQRKKKTATTTLNELLAATTGTSTQMWSTKGAKNVPNQTSKGPGNEVTKAAMKAQKAAAQSTGNQQMTIVGTAGNPLGNIVGPGNEVTKAAMPAQSTAIQQMTFGGTAGTPFGNVLGQGNEMAKTTMNKQIVVNPRGNQNQQMELQMAIGATGGNPLGNLVQSDKNNWLLDVPEKFRPAIIEKFKLLALANQPEIYAFLPKINPRDGLSHPAVFLAEWIVNQYFPMAILRVFSRDEIRETKESLSVISLKCETSEIRMEVYAFNDSALQLNGIHAGSVVQFEHLKVMSLRQNTPAKPMSPNYRLHFSISYSKLKILSMPHSRQHRFLPICQQEDEQPPLKKAHMEGIGNSSEIVFSNNDNNNRKDDQSEGEIVFLGDDNNEEEEGEDGDDGGEEQQAQGEEESIAEQAQHGGSNQGRQQPV